MSDKCYGCEYYVPPYDGDFSLEGYAEPEPPMCQQPNLMELADGDENAAVLIENILFWISEHGNCPFRRNKVYKGRRKLGSYRAVDLNPHVKSALWIQKQTGCSWKEALSLAGSDE